MINYNAESPAPMREAERLDLFKTDRIQRGQLERYQRYGLTFKTKKHGNIKRNAAPSDDALRSYSGANDCIRTIKEFMHKMRKHR